MSGHRDFHDARHAAGKERLGKAIATAVSNHPGDYQGALAEYSNAVRADDFIQKSMLKDLSAEVLRDRRDLSGDAEGTVQEALRRVEAFRKQEVLKSGKRSRSVKRGR
jgi:hypothetical protein